MSTTIKRDFEFQTGVYYEETFLLNYYTINLTLSVETDSIREQNIAMDRIKYFLHECLETSIFVEASEKKVIDKYLAADLRVCTLPEEPYDQIVTLMILSKLNAITEGRLVVTDIVLSSLLSDEVKFVYDYESFAAANPFEDGWWSNPSTNINDLAKSSKKEKIVKLVKNNDWALVGLEWKEKESKTAEIIFSPDLGK